MGSADERNLSGLTWYAGKARRKFWNWDVYKGRVAIGCAYGVTLWVFEDSQTQVTHARVEVVSPEFQMVGFTSTTELPMKGDKLDTRKLKEWAKNWVTDCLVSPMEMLANMTKEG